MNAEAFKLENLKSDFQNQKNSVAIGFFDGVHVGHKNLIFKMLEHAKKKSNQSLVFTFENSPKEVLYKDLFKGYLTEKKEKISILKSYGVNNIVLAHFDQDFANMSCDEFVGRILAEKLNAETVFVGYNFTYGSNREGNASLLKKQLSEFGISCDIIDQVEINGETVSSSVIRNEIEKGNFEKANLFLGREFAYGGTVEHGDARGRTMGFPTANLPLKDTRKILPPNGVYACFADTEHGTFPAVVNMGYRPTFDRDIHLLEAHLIGFTGNLYDRPIRVRFVKMLRPEVKFNSASKLIAQIKSDKEAAKHILNS